MKGEGGRQAINGFTGYMCACMCTARHTVVYLCACIIKVNCLKIIV